YETCSGAVGSAKPGREIWWDCRVQPGTRRWLLDFKGPGSPATPPVRRTASSASDHGAANTLRINIGTSFFHNSIYNSGLRLSWKKGAQFSGIFYHTGKDASTENKGFTLGT